ncbi:unnamed protein product [Ectocarpus fasciculatus]
MSGGSSRTWHWRRGSSQAYTLTRSSNPLRAWAGAKLELRNESDYRVSYWVVNEDKLTTAAVKRRVFRNIEDQLNDGGSDRINAKHHNAKHGWDVINAEHALDDEYFIRRDYRPDPATAKKLRFPKGSRQLRVYTYAWFERQKEWRVFRDKVCDNGRGKRFRISATNQCVEPFEM